MFEIAMSRSTRRGQAERRAEDVRQRRIHGHRIKSGLHELGELDAVQPTTAESATSSSSTAPPLAKKLRMEMDQSPSSVDDSSTNNTPSAMLSVFGDGWSAWRHVKTVLFDPQSAVAMKRAALTHIAVWRARGRKYRQLPPYVECTELLYEAVLFDEEDSQRRADGASSSSSSSNTATSSLLPGYSTQQLALMYSAAIARVVHVMMGSFAVGQADTYRKRAREIRFPEEAVEVRQRVAHGALPHITELRWAAGLVLQYLFTEYWSLQEEHIVEMEREEALQAAPSTTSASRKRGREEAKATPTVQDTHVSVSEMQALLRELGSDDEAEDEDDQTSTTAMSAVTLAADPSEVLMPPPVVAGWTLTPGHV